MNTKTQTTIVHLLSDGHACTEFIDDITIERATRGRDNYSMSSRKRRDYAAIVAVLEMPVRESGTYTVTMDGIEGASYIDGDVLFTSVEVTKT